MIPKGIPREVGNDPVVLVAVVAGNDEVGHNGLGSYPVVAGLCAAGPAAMRHSAETHCSL